MFTLQRGKQHAIAHTLPAEHDGSEDGTGRGIPLVAGCLQERDSKGSDSDTKPGHLIPVVYENHPADSRITESGDTAPTVTSRYGTGGGNVPLVGPKATAIRTANTNANANGHGVAEDVAHTLDQAQGQAIVSSFKTGQSSRSRGIGYEEERSPSLEGGGGGNNKPAVHVGMQVRRLTPTECERLQGFPDGYTAVKFKGKPAADGPRYKALGNSMAVPVMSWIGRRIQMVEDLKNG